MRVCILGKNLTSLTLAKALINKDIDVDLFFSNTKNNINHTRTLGISKSNVEFVNQHIVNIENILWKLNKIEIFTDQLKQEKLLNFEDNKDQLFSIIKNHQFCSLLEGKLLKKKNFKKKSYNNKDLSLVQKYELIINCDIKNNISKKFFSKNIQKKYNSFAYTTIINHEKVVNDTATQIFTKQGPLAYLPISNLQTSVVFSVHNALNNKKEGIRDLIFKHNNKYKIKNISEIEFFELSSSNLRSYYYKNILAFGDLLHKVHPLAGQGFNMTIRDIKELLNIIKNKLDLGLELDSSVNKEFEKNVKYKNFIFSNGVDLIHEFFNYERKTKNSVLSKSIQILGKNSSANKAFIKIADEGIFF
jgi:2-octaprenyl-6-methoxyphenol hydroxylase